MTVSQWADSARKLSPEASAEPGSWDTSRAEYQRGIMDAVSDPAVERVVVKSSAQVGKTEIALNTLGFHIDHDPAPILLLQPTVEMGEAFSKDRLAPMLRDTPALRGKVKDARSRDSGNTTLHKAFPGGHVTIAGANSPASLASRPIRILLADEVDRYPDSAGTEGDPVSLAVKRTTTFWNAKVVMVSTPTVKGASRIDAAYGESDQRVFLAVCQDCGHEQRLMWSGVRFEDRDPQTARYMCEECGTLWDDIARVRAVRAGRWQATAPFRGVAGFHLSELYSPWRKLAQTVQDFLDSKDDPNRLQTWVNTALGETWEDRTGSLDDAALSLRGEGWGLELVPEPVLVVTAGVDVQHDRFEITVLGWSEDGAMWVLGHHVIHGDVLKDDEPWRDLSEFLKQSFPHEIGGRIEIAATCVDSGDGATSKQVVSFCRARRSAFAIKGEDGFKRGLIVRSQGKDKALWIVGSDTGKRSLFRRLQALKPPGQSDDPYAGSLVRFSSDLQGWWFEQLVSERLISTKQRGMPVQRFERIEGRRAEALDCVVYGTAARQLVHVNWAARRDALVTPEVPVQKAAARKAAAEDGWLQVRDNWL